MEEGREEGRKEGRVKGRTEGIDYEKRNTILRMSDCPVDMLMRMADATKEFVVSVLQSNGITPVY